MARVPITAHRHLALVWCDSSGSLAEVLTTIDLSDVPHQRFGERAIAVPAPYAVEIRRALRESGSFPRVVGELLRPEVTDDGEDE